MRREAITVGWDSCVADEVIAETAVCGQDMRERRFADGSAPVEIGRIVDLCARGLDLGPLLVGGGGDGPFTAAFAGRGWTVSTVREEGWRGATALPYTAGAFDLAFLDRVLHRVDDPLRALKEARRVALRRVAVLEWPYRAEEHGPPLRRRLRGELLESLAAAAGFAQVLALPLARQVLYLLTPAET